jgi:chemotaxis protein MotB
MAHDKPTVIVKIRKKGGHAGHHGGAWKVAYADFITCMFALFMVLWLLTQADLKLRQDIARYFRNPGIQSGGSLIGDSVQNEQGRPQAVDAAQPIVPGNGEEIKVLRGQAGKIQEALESTPELQEIKDQVHVEVTAEGLEIQVIDSGSAGREDLLFDLNSAALKPELVKLLEKIAPPLGKLPNRVEIGGHTDARQFAAGSGLSNWDLSFARANNARRVLESSGLRAGQVLRIAAYGDAKPLDAANPLADENRRLSILARRTSAKDAGASDADGTSDAGAAGGGGTADASGGTGGLAGAGEPQTAAPTASPWSIAPVVAQPGVPPT